MSSQAKLGALQAGGFRLASVEPEFPYRERTTPFILVTREGNLYLAQTVTDKRRLLTRWREGDLLLAVWPRQQRSDVFIIDDLPTVTLALQQNGRPASGLTF